MYSFNDDLKSKLVDNNQKSNNIKVIFLFVKSRLFIFIYIYIYIYIERERERDRLMQFGV